METERTYYIQTLNCAFEERKLKNKQFSLRAFARDLGINSGTLSRILKGERTPSITLGKQLAVVLKLEGRELDLFLNSLAERKWKQAPERIGQDLKSFGRPSSASTPSGEEKIQSYQIELEKFRFLADWIHYALMELTFVSDFQNDTSWMAQKLGRSKSDVESALRRLKSLGLIEEIDGKLMKKNQRVTTADKTQTRAYLKNMQKDLLELATQGLDQVDISKRIASSMTMAINPKNIEKVRPLFSQFLSEICELLEEGEQQEVYHLLVNLSPANISRKENKNECITN